MTPDDSAAQPRTERRSPSDTEVDAAVAAARSPTLIERAGRAAAHRDRNP